jgi:hypothetical protein
MSDDKILHATPLSEKPAVPAPADMAPRKVGDLDVTQSRLVRERQQARARMMGLVLAGLCVLFFAITVVKVGVWG